MHANTARVLAQSSKHSYFIQEETKKISDYLFKQIELSAYNSQFGTSTTCKSKNITELLKARFENLGYKVHTEHVVTNTANFYRITLDWS